MQPTKEATRTMKEVIKVCKLAGFIEFWAILFEAKWCGVPYKRSRYIMVASVSGIENWFLQQVLFFFLRHGISMVLSVPSSFTFIDAKSLSAETVSEPLPQALSQMLEAL